MFALAFPPQYFPSTLTTLCAGRRLLNHYDSPLLLLLYFYYCSYLPLQGAHRFLRPSPSRLGR
jgi:hypothetical protein